MGKSTRIEYNLRGEAEEGVGLHKYVRGMDPFDFALFYPDPNAVKLAKNSIFSHWYWTLDSFTFQ